MKKLLPIFFLLISLPSQGNIAAECNFNSSEYLEELSSLESLKQVKVNVLKYKQWTKNVLKAALNSGPILPIYKKKFEAEIESYYEFGSCKHKGKIRLHGDWKDHIDFLEGGKIIQSIDVSLSNGSIGNFTKFKLLLPETRNGENEVFLANILRALNFLAPKTRLINASINNEKSVMLMQEKPEKEMLEGMYTREGPLFEGDERFLFSNYKDFDDMDLLDISLSKLTNKKWAENNFHSSNIAFSSFSLLQMAYIDYVNTLPLNSYSMNWSLLSGGNNKLISKWAQYEILLFAAQASHALLPHNRKYYFNSFYKGFEPVYWDGEPRSLKGTWIRIKPDYKYYQYLETRYFDELIELLESLLAKNMEALDDLPLIKSDNYNYHQIIENLILKVKILKDEFINFKQASNHVRYGSQQYSPPFFTKKISNHFDSYGIIELLPDTQKQAFNAKTCINGLELCSNNLLEFLQIGSLLKNKSLSSISSVDPSFLLPQLNQLDDWQNKPPLKYGKITIQKSKSAIVKFNQAKKNLDISMSKPDDWVLIIDSDLDDIFIRVSSFVIDQKLGIEKKSSSRINSEGLTGCVSIYNSTFAGTKINSNTPMQNCEDAINIINSSGHIASINISNAKSDALDIDFSFLDIERLSVKNSGNDCLDLSSGTYSLKRLEINNCGDKGVSIGEKSDVDIQEAYINKTLIGIASKDSSKSNFNTLVVTDSTQCIDVYQKKQEFFGSTLSVKKLSCNTSNINVDIHSSLYLNEL
ncbi:hypothetical protein N9Q01_02030 [Gammaproteobacteria bacterium]|nr:hypothetical protein [Gammaproteobacteria bacterium]